MGKIDSLVTVNETWGLSVVMVCTSSISVVNILWVQFLAEWRGFSLLQSTETGTGHHITSYTMCHNHRDKVAISGRWLLTSISYQTGISLLSPYGFIVWCLIKKRYSFTLCLAVAFGIMYSCGWVPTFHGDCSCLPCRSHEDGIHRVIQVEKSIFWQVIKCSSSWEK